MATITKTQFAALADLVTITTNAGNPLVALVDRDKFTGKAKISGSGGVKFVGRGKLFAKLPAITKAEWESGKAALPIMVAGGHVSAKPMFSAKGSCNYKLFGKVPLELSTGDIVECQVSGDATLVNTADLDDNATIGGLSTLQCCVYVTPVGSAKWAD